MDHYLPLTTDSLLPTHYSLLTRRSLLATHCVQDGLYVDCEPEAECLRRVWKLTCRARQDRGEVVYQATLNPQPVGRQRLFVPWSDFQLVRGPRLVPDMPPLSVADVNATYQVSVVATKFMLSATGETLENFLPGRFRLRIFSLGAGGATAAVASRSADATAATAVIAAALPRGGEDSTCFLVTRLPAGRKAALQGSARQGIGRRARASVLAGRVAGLRRGRQAAQCHVPKRTVSNAYTFGYGHHASGYGARK